MSGGRSPPPNQRLEGTPPRCALRRPSAAPLGVLRDQVEHIATLMGCPAQFDWTRLLPIREKAKDTRSEPVRHISHAHPILHYKHTDTPGRWRRSLCHSVFRKGVSESIMARQAIGRSDNNPESSEVDGLQLIRKEVIRLVRDPQFNYRFGCESNGSIQIANVRVDISFGSRKNMGRNTDLSSRNGQTPNQPMERTPPRCARLRRSSAR